MSREQSAELVAKGLAAAALARAEGAAGTTDEAADWILIANDLEAATRLPTLKAFVEAMDCLGIAGDLATAAGWPPGDHVAYCRIRGYVHELIRSIP